MPDAPQEKLDFATAAEAVHRFVEMFRGLDAIGDVLAELRRRSTYAAELEAHIAASGEKLAQVEQAAAGIEIEYRTRMGVIDGEIEAQRQKLRDAKTSHADFLASSAAEVERINDEHHQAQLKLTAAKAHLRQLAEQGD